MNHTIRNIFFLLGFLSISISGIALDLNHYFKKSPAQKSFDCIKENKAKKNDLPEHFFEPVDETEPDEDEQVRNASHHVIQQLVYALCTSGIPAKSNFKLPHIFNEVLADTSTRISLFHSWKFHLS